jgi:hypothetical protein
MNQSKDKRNRNENVNCDTRNGNENTSRSSTPVSIKQMVIGQMTVVTMNNNNYARSQTENSRSQTPNFDK